MKKRITHLLLLASVSILHSQVLPFNPNLKPFYHGVASGDPIEDRVILWTRVTPEHDTLIEGSFVMALDTALQMIVKSGSFSTDSSKDYTVKLDVTGLRSNTTYYYAFTAFGKRSPIGRTKTTPGSRDNNLNEILRFAVVACSNFEGGYFNAYNGIAARNDLDAVIHLGDYIYEYGQGEYRNIHLPDTERDHYPKSELLVKNDYRNRYSQYRLDSDLQRMHQQHPMIAVWDDHETADDAYDTGAGNHQANEGDWEERKRMAKEAYFEWIPIRGEAAHTDLYRRITYGNLMDLFILDTRMDGRVKQPEQFDEPDDSLNPRRMMSTKQYNWLFEGIKSSSARWKVIGNQVIFSDVNVGFAASDPTSYEEVSFYENLFTDNWKGYKIQRNAIIDSLQLNSIDNVVILTGDSHSSWAMDVTKKPVLYPEEQFGYLPQANPYDSTTRQGYNSERRICMYRILYTFHLSCKLC
jgi:alkaline phosphatase D